MKTIMQPHCLTLLLLLSFLAGNSQTLHSEAGSPDSSVSSLSTSAPARVTRAFVALASPEATRPIGPVIYPSPPINVNAGPLAFTDTTSKHKSRWWRPVVTGFVCGFLTVLLTSSLR
jgi:hypothetical protein